jgi:sacsin
MQANHFFACSAATDRSTGYLSLPSNIIAMLGSLQPVDKVFMNDAPRNPASELHILHSSVSYAGRHLGGKSVRDELSSKCEAPGGQPFGQEANLVDQAKLLLSDYNSKDDVIKEFVQNTDDFGAEEPTFILCEKVHPHEKLVDERAEALQGPSLYICSSKPLKEEDIQRMQHVGRSDKRQGFHTSGRFGVGLNVMYRYSRCPQLLANGNLHFFDLTRSYVARGRNN